ncbi:MAG: hypothetical protein ABR611_14585 [Chthoniobacterales bacterium]
MANITLGIDSLFQPTFEYFGNKLRDYLKGRIERESRSGADQPGNRIEPRFNLWSFMPVFSYYANLVAPVCHALSQGAIVRFQGGERQLRGDKDRLEISRPAEDQGDSRAAPEGCVPAQINTDHGRTLSLWIRDPKAKTARLVDVPLMFTMLPHLKTYLRIEDTEFVQWLDRARADFMQQLADMAAHDEKNRNFVIVNK